MTKEVEGVYPAGGAHMVGDGFKVVNYFPNGNRLGKKISPFFLLDYHPSYNYPPTNKKRGVGVHPHRGFETVTMTFEGYVAHNDSAGNSGVIGPGDVQWMTAGSGVLHKEYHEKEFAAKGGSMQMLQLWVNLPRAAKMTTPKYQAITKEMIPIVTLPGNAGKLLVIAGSFNGTKGPASTFTPINIYRVQLNQGGQVAFTLPQQHNTGILVINGNVKINSNETVGENNFLLFGYSGNEIKAMAESDAEFIVLDGEPINEPVVQYGPFLMNTPAEINQAIEDVNNGKFGVLKDD